MPLTTMYAGKINSPSTTLTADISAYDTTIYVADGSVLPPGENIATIGTGEDAETIKYTTKVGNTLSGITRGFEGTQKVWGAGESIARMLTNYDYDAIINNVEGVIVSPTTPEQGDILYHDGSDWVARHHGDKGAILESLGHGANPEWTPQPTLIALSDAPVKGGVFNGGFGLAPPFTAETITSARWIDGTAGGSTTNDVYGWYSGISTNGSLSFGSTVSHSGKNSLKLSTMAVDGKVYSTNYDTAGLPNFTKYSPRIKPSTKYRFVAWVKTNNVAADAVYCTLYQSDPAGVTGTTINSSKVTGTNDWQPLIINFTSDNDAEFLNMVLWNYVTGNVSDAWFDDITLDEIVGDTTFTGTIPTPVRPTIVGVTTTDNIDQSLDSGWAAAQHYDLPIAVDEGATHRQTFTPTKNKVTNIAIKTVLKGTGNWTLIVHDAANAVLAAQIILIASLSDNTVTTFNVPNLWASGNLHFHLYSSVADGTVLTTGVHDLETVSYIQYYAKPTENCTVVCNGEKISLSADQDGILSGAIIDLDKGKYLWGCGATVDVAKISDIYSASVGETTTAPIVVNGWQPGVANGFLEIDSKKDATARNFVYRINTILPIKHLKIKSTIFSAEAVNKLVQVSSDGVNYTTITTVNNATDAYYTNIDETDLVNGLSTFYVRLFKSTDNDYLAGNVVKIEADLDTSTIPSIILQPLGTMPQFSDEVVLPDATSGVRLYHRAAKYANKNGVVVPHLEFCTSGAVAIKAIPCGFDNSGCTSPCIQILDINGDATGYPLHDGDYCAVSPALSNRVTYKMRASSGETISAITMNRLYLSSNGVANSATKDPSHQFNFYLGMLKHGIQKVVEKLQGAVNDIARAIHWEWGLIVASGTAYALTTTLAVINFGTTGNLEINLPDVGIYEITALVHDDMSAVTVSAAANYSLYQPYIDGVAMTNGEQMGLRTSILAAAAVGMDANTVYLSWIISSSHPGTLVSIYAKKNSATTGAWNVVSDATGWTKLRYKRIA